MKNNLYKIGRHTGTEKKLVSRYNTYLINTTVHMFEEVDDCVAREKEIHSDLHKYRIKRETGQYSEWFNCSLGKIKTAFGTGSRCTIM